MTRKDRSSRTSGRRGSVGLHVGHWTLEGTWGMVFVCYLGFARWRTAVSQQHHSVQYMPPLQCTLANQNHAVTIFASTYYEQEALNRPPTRSSSAGSSPRYVPRPCTSSRTLPPLTLGGSCSPHQHITPATPEHQSRTPPRSPPAQITTRPRLARRKRRSKTTSSRDTTSKHVRPRRRPARTPKRRAGRRSGRTRRRSGRRAFGSARRR